MFPFRDEAERESWAQRGWTWGQLCMRVTVIKLMTSKQWHRDTRGNTMPSQVTSQHRPLNTPFPQEIPVHMCKICSILYFSVTVFYIFCTAPLKDTSLTAQTHTDAHKHIREPRIWNGFADSAEHVTGSMKFELKTSSRINQKNRLLGWSRLTHEQKEHRTQLKGGLLCVSSWSIKVYLTR